jgi:hypothetical protein
LDPLLHGLRGLFIAILQVPYLGFRFYRGIYMVTFMIGTLLGAHGPLHVWASIGLKGSAQLSVETSRRCNGPLGLLLVWFGAWRSSCLHAKAFVSPSLSVRPSDEVFAWRCPRIPSHSFRPYGSLLNLRRLLLSLSLSPKFLVSVHPAEGSFVFYLQQI